MRKQTLGILAGVLVSGAIVATPLATAIAQTQPDGTVGPMVGQGHGALMGGFGSGPMMGGHGPMMGYGAMGVGSAGQVGPNAGAPSDMAAHFIEEMIPHHEDAVAMADLALAQAEHQEIRDLAAAIKQTQTVEIEQMRRWYQEWYGREVGPSQMASMPMMAGMMGGHDAAALDGAQPFDKAFIEAMIPHHQMAIMMSTHMQAGIDRPELRDLLQSIATSQAAEIDQMRQWYQDWYGTPVPGQAPGAGAGGASMPAPGMAPGTGPGMGAGAHHGAMPHHGSGGATWKPRNAASRTSAPAC